MIHLATRSTTRDCAQADFQNTLKEVYTSQYGSKI